jgi:hypothetical protein
MCIPKEIGNNGARKNRLKNYLIPPKKVLFDAYGLELNASDLLWKNANNENFPKIRNHNYFERIV